MITLQTTRFRAVVSPEHGAILTDLVWLAPGGREMPLLYSPAGTKPTTVAPNFMGLWTMLPFANRAFDCVIDDGTRRFTVPVNDPAKASNIHGFGWQSVWQVTRQDASSLVMEHARAGVTDPYSYRATLGIELGADLVRIALSITNLAQHALPYGAGFHPWFNAAPDSHFRMASGGRLALGEDYRATGLVSHADGGPFAEAAPVGALAQELAVSVVDWVDEAVLTTSSLGLALHIDASPNFRHPVLWAPAGSNFVCFEPQSHGIGAPGIAAARAITPLAQLQPGETLEGWMTIRPKKAPAQGPGQGMPW
jgi:aldose 1-epimerase